MPCVLCQHASIMLSNESAWLCTASDGSTDHEQIKSPTLFAVHSDAHLGCTAHREKYWEYEYEEVISPNIYNFDLWRTSGHADHYKENMFYFEIEKQEFGLKPMNCPGWLSC